MAQLKDLIVTGATRLIGNAYIGSIQITTLNAPTTAGGNAYGPGTNGYVLKSNGSSVYWGSDNNAGGTVTSVRVQATSPVTSSQNTAQTGTLNTTIALADGYGDTKNPYASKTKNYVLAAGATANSAPSFRALVEADIPALSWSKITSGNDDLKAIEALTGTSGLLKKTAANTWTLDTTAYTTNTGTVTSVRVQATSPVTSSVNTAQTGTLNTTIALADGYGDTKNPYASKTKNYVLAAGATANSVPSFRALVAADIPTLSITDKTSGTLTVARGGTNNTAFTANRLVYGESASKLSSATSLYATASSLAINKTSITSGYNFEVSGKTYLNGMTLIKGLKGTSGTDYGEILPDTAEEGQIFFQLSDVQYELPNGGTTGQVLVKNSNNDRDVTWGTGIPSGGTTGQFLRGDNVWSNELQGALKLTHDGSNGPSITIINPNMQKGVTPDENHWSNIWFTDQTGNSNYEGNRLGGIELCRSHDDGGNHIYMQVFKPQAMNSDCGTIYLNYILANNEFQAGAHCKFYGAVWNDYAEYRASNEIEAGRCVREVGDGTLIRTTERLQKGCEIVSDTFGFAIGKTEKYNTPTAASGRVLAYLYEGYETAKTHIGDPVCSGPNGTVSIMSEEEEMRYPSRIIGTISEIPSYDIWEAGHNGDHQIKVNGRIWIRIR